MTAYLVVMGLLQLWGFGSTMQRLARVETPRPVDQVAHVIVASIHAILVGWTVHLAIVGGGR